MTFTSTDWSTAQTVTVAAVEDDDGDSGSVTITHAVVDADSDDDYDDVPNDVTLVVAVSDDDTAAIVVTAGENFGVMRVRHRHLFGEVGYQAGQRRRHTVDRHGRRSHR